jgi:xanthine dehydrogenase accessory factor
VALSENLILVRGGGDLGTGVAHRLHMAGLRVVIAELPQPLMVRRGVAFAEAVYAGTHTVEGVTARRVPDVEAAQKALENREIPVLVDPAGDVWRRLNPAIVVDARLAKRPLDAQITDAPLVVALGPGFVAGEHCHAVVETMRGHRLGRVYWHGSAAPDTGKPEPVRGFAGERVLRAPREGVLRAYKAIGDHILTGDAIASVSGQPVIAPFSGVLRGLLHEGLTVTTGLKIGDLDPRGAREHCFTIADKARAVGGGVLEAVMGWISREKTVNSQQ